MPQVFVFVGIVNTGRSGVRQTVFGDGTVWRGAGQDWGGYLVVARSSGCDCKFGGNLQVSELRKGAEAGVPVPLKARNVIGGGARESWVVRCATGAQAEGYAAF